MHRLSLLFVFLVAPACGGKVFVDGGGGFGGTSPSTSSGLGGAPSTSSVSSTSISVSVVVVASSSTTDIASSSAITSASSSESSSSESSSSSDVASSSSSAVSSSSASSSSASASSSSSVASSSAVTSSSSSGAGGGDGGVCCSSDDQNDQHPPGQCGAAQIWIAWEYQPSCDLALDRLEVHVPQGRIAFFADAGGQPGAVLLDAALTPTGAPGWAGADLSPPIPVAPGQRYWIATKAGTCSVAAHGRTFKEWTSPNLTGPWDGPFMGDLFTSHILGACP